MKVFQFVGKTQQAIVCGYADIASARESLMRAAGASPVESDVSRNWYEAQATEITSPIIFFSEVEPEAEAPVDPLNETIRQVLRRRDGEDDDTISEMLAEARARLAAGEDPDVVLSEEFGLEPDYIYDRELGLFD